MRDFNDRVAVVTGAASGIGLAMAKQFAAEGMRLALADVDESALDGVAAGLADAGTEVLAVPTDVSDPVAVAGLAEQVIEGLGRVDLVCNNAGVGPAGGILEMGLEEWHWVMSVNFYGVLHGVRAFLPLLMEQLEGHIVNTASVSGLLTQPGLGAYNVSKFGVVALSEVLYQELQILDANVGVSVVCPATVATGIFDADLHRSGDRPARSIGPIGDRARLSSERLLAMAHRSADDVAAAVLDAVRNRRFYILTHPGILPFVEVRHRDIEQMRNPTVDQGL